MHRCVIFGGTGYVGSMLAERLAAGDRFDEIVVADLKPTSRPVPPKVRFVPCDVRSEIAPHVVASNADWIFNFASAARASGRDSVADTLTHLSAARSICAYATRIGCSHLFFGSSGDVYSPGEKRITENTPPSPLDVHGLSLLASELIHQNWVKDSLTRQLIIVRTAPVYGSGIPGEIQHLLAAVRKSRFYFYSGAKDTRQSHAYIDGLLDSIEFTMTREETVFTYHYAERNAEPVETLFEIARRTCGTKTIMIPVPTWIWRPLSRATRTLTASRTHTDEPAAALEPNEPRWLQPAVLERLGFRFPYDFARSLDHWRRTHPEDW